MNKVKKCLGNISGPCIASWASKYKSHQFLFPREFYVFYVYDDVLYPWDECLYSVYIYIGFWCVVNNELTIAQIQGEKKNVIPCI